MADAQFAIDIAASMPEGPATSAQLDSLTERLMAGGKNADFFSEAIARATAEVGQAKAASEAANRALDEGNAIYRQLELHANQTAKAAEKAALKNAGVVPPELAAKVQEANAWLTKYAEQLKKVEANAKTAEAAQAKSQGTLDNLGKLQGHVNKTLGEQAEGLEKLRGVLASTGGPLGAFASKALAPAQGFSKLSASMGESKAMAIVTTAAVAALTVALLAAGAAALTWGVGLASSNREANLSAQAVAAMHDELNGLDSTLANISGMTGQSVASLQQLAIKLHDAHVSATELPAALNAVATQEAALGKGGSEKFFNDLKAGKKSVAELAAETESKLGGIVAKQMMGLGAQSEKLQRNFADIFGGLNIDPLLQGFKLIVDLFDKNTASGQALKFMFEGLFQPIINAIPKAATLAEALFLRLEIWALKAYLALRPYTPLFNEIGGVIGTVAGFFVDLAAAVWPVAAAVGAVVAAAALLTSPLFLAIAAVTAVVEAFRHWEEIKTFLAGLVGMLPEVGQQMVMGLVNGIVGGAKFVVDAMTGVVGGAVNAAKKALGIASPSKVFADIGDNTAMGFTGAVNDNAADAQAAVTNMVAPDPKELEQAQLSGNADAVAAMQGGGAAPAAPAAKGGGGSVTGNTFIFNGVKDAEHGAELMIEAITKCLEGDAAQLGTDTVDEAAA